MRWIYAGRIWLKEWKRKSWTSTKLKRAREEPLKAEVTPWNGEEYAKARDMKLESGEKIAGREIFSLFREYNLQRLQSKQEELTEEEEMKQQWLS